MSNNSYPCRPGGEIGRAQVAQAEACGLEPEPAMNPILLKPSGNGASQVVVNGRVWKTLTAARVLRARRGIAADVSWRRTRIWPAASTSVVIEGAGSVSELNLREHDLVEPRSGDPDSRAVDARRRYRARRRVRLGDRHDAPSDSGRARAVSRIRDQQVPRRRVAVRRGRADPGRARRRRPASACFRTPPTSTSTPRTASRCRPGRERRRRRARGSRSSDCRTCRTRPTSGC